MWSVNQKRKISNLESYYLFYKNEENDTEKIELHIVGACGVAWLNFSKTLGDDRGEFLFCLYLIRGDGRMIKKEKKTQKIIS